MLFAFLSNFFRKIFKLVLQCHKRVFLDHQSRGVLRIKYRFFFRLYHTETYFAISPRKNHCGCCEAARVAIVFLNPGSVGMLTPKRCGYVELKISCTSMGLPHLPRSARENRTRVNRCAQRLFRLHGTLTAELSDRQQVSEFSVVLKQNTGTASVASLESSGLKDRSCPDLCAWSCRWLQPGNNR